MYDSGKIITGLVIFVAIFTYPLWSNLGAAAPVPKPQLPPKNVATQCVADTNYMRTSHMVMLNVAQISGRFVDETSQFPQADVGLNSEFAQFFTEGVCH